MHKFTLCPRIYFYWAKLYLFTPLCKMAAGWKALIQSKSALSKVAIKRAE
jgi:hypothetical protein